VGPTTWIVELTAATESVSFCVLRGKTRIAAVQNSQTPTDPSKAIQDSEEKLSSQIGKQ